MNNVLQQGILRLIYSAITGQAMPMPESFDLEQAQMLIQKHQIGNLIYYGASNCGLDTKQPQLRKLFETTYQCMLVDERQRKELSKLFAAFDANQIHYMPLKGVLMKHLYPQTDMRIMGDADIMIKLEQYEKIQQIMAELGYVFKVETDHELVWENAGLHLELHKRLLPEYNGDFAAYYGDCWRLGKPTADNPFRYEMTDEDQMIYLFTHFAKHFRNGGIGIRHMTDLYVYKKAKPNMDEDYLALELKKLQMYDFYCNIFHTLEVWFENGTANEKTDLITEHVFSSGAYGTSDRRNMAEAIRTRAQKKESAKQIQRKKWIKVIFLPYTSMCVTYPCLKKAPVLLPIMWIARWVKILVKKPQRILYQRQQIKLLQEDTLDTFEGRMNSVGVTFDFGEDDE